MAQSHLERATSFGYRTKDICVTEHFTERRFKLNILNDICNIFDRQKLAAAHTQIVYHISDKLSRHINIDFNIKMDTGYGFMIVGRFNMIQMEKLSE